ncbi:hypothetical protein EYF80_041243 [Liparis tanakae]|uniref:Uncharacterized protein n=1 Tax=Liparis tanakae TaxID=230148 RepID=A0A4Z2G4P7_9TELE|nr:hypothetical protein EYF80_041243 [Liparis tanakae]
MERRASASRGRQTPSQEEHHALPVMETFSSGLIVLRTSTAKPHNHLLKGGGAGLLGTILS